MASQCMDFDQLFYIQTQQKITSFLHDVIEVVILR